MSFQASLDTIKAKTGKTPDDFRLMAEEKGLLTAGVPAGPIIAQPLAEQRLVRSREYTFINRPA